MQRRQASSTLQCCSPGCCCPHHGGIHKRSCCKCSPHHQGTRNGRHKQRRQASSTLQHCSLGCSYHHHGGTHRHSCCACSPHRHNTNKDRGSPLFMNDHHCSSSLEHHEDTRDRDLGHRGNHASTNPCTWGSRNHLPARQASQRTGEGRARHGQDHTRGHAPTGQGHAPDSSQQRTTQAISSQQARTSPVSKPTQVCFLQRRPQRSNW